jgi:predicted type IV restriction endonuclease
LTNGLQYNFYTDLDAANKMDEKPFLSFDITTIKDQQIKELAKFHKSGFDVNSILNTASDLKYSNAIKAVLINEISNPSSEFVKFFVSRVYEGRASEKIMAQFTDIVKRTIEQSFTDIVSDRLMNAINQTKPQVVDIPIETQALSDDDDNRIITTEEELNGFYIIKSILRTKVSTERIVHRDTINYFGILLDDNNRKPLCRLWLNSPNKKYIGLFDKDKKETKYEISCLDDIYNYADQLLQIPDFYEGTK